MLVRDLVAYLLQQDGDAIVTVEQADGDYSDDRHIETPTVQALPGYVSLQKGGPA